MLFVKTDPYRGIVNPYFLELQQKNAEAGQNCPYDVMTYDIMTFDVMLFDVLAYDVKTYDVI